ncbi:hypothetical protein RHECNPAF_1700030 [Rhizobium etli CNPAF512]|nr:hypothetical protein RHECNPAF_1700030 [Rhizobium etli CNPAF512]
MATPATSRRLLPAWALKKPSLGRDRPLEDSRQPLREFSGIFRPVAVQNARLVEQQECCVLLIGGIVLDRCDSSDQRMGQVDFQNWLGGALETTCILQNLFHLPVITILRRNEADCALRQPVGCTDIGDLTGQFLLGEADEDRQAGAIQFLRCLTIGGWKACKIRSSLRDGLECLAFELRCIHRPEAVDRVGQQQDFDAARPKAFQLWRCLQLVEAATRKIVDGILAFFRVFDVFSQGTVAFGQGRGTKARKRHQLRAPLVVFVNAFLQDSSEVLPELEVGVRLAIGHFLDGGDDPVRDAFADRRQDRAFLDHFARNIERQISRIDQAPDKAQISRHQFRVVGDEDALDVKLHPPLAIRVKHVERLCSRHKGESRVFMPAFGTEVHGKDRFIVLTGHAAVEVGIFFLADFALRFCPERGAVGNLNRFAARLFNKPDCDGNMAGLFFDDPLDSPPGSVFLRILHQMQDNARAALWRLGKIYRSDAVTPLAVRGPLRGFLRAGAAGDHVDPIRDHEAGIEADAELADQLSAFTGFARCYAIHESPGPRPRNRPEGLDHFVALHPDAVVLHDELSALVVQRQRDTALGN